MPDLEGVLKMDGLYGERREGRQTQVRETERDMRGVCDTYRHTDLERQRR